MKETAMKQMFGKNNIITDDFNIALLEKYRRRLNTLLALILMLLCANLVSAQTNTGTDQSNVRSTQGDVNDSGNLSLGVPLGNYPGRGLNLPISLSYSSSVWKIEHLGTVQNYQVYPASGVKQSVTQAMYSQYSTSGWKNSLELPVIEFPKFSETYNNYGRPGFGYSNRIAKVFIHMPDGATHELRKNDSWYQSNSSIDMSGIFYAIDGSRIRFDSAGTGDTGTIYMPDGTQYVLGHPTSSITDRNGNTMSFNETTRQWTDTLGRVIANPFPVTPQVEDINYDLPGLGGASNGQIHYVFKWRALADALTPDANGNTPALQYMASDALPSPNALPSQSNYPQSQEDAQHQGLFKSEYAYDDMSNVSYPVKTIVVGKGQSIGQTFNPVVLSEIVLPDGTSYKFSYNTYGEINKVVYPTGAYEKYDYSIPNTESGEDYPYIEAARVLTSKKLSIDGTGSNILEWKYSVSALLDGGGSSSTINPDKTRTEVYKYGPGNKNWQQLGPSGGQYLAEFYAFGLKDGRVGMPSVKKFFSSSTDGTGGQLLREELYQYEQTSTNQTTVSPQTVAFNRNPRLARVTNIIFEGTGSTLAQTNTFVYDSANQYSTGVDQTLAATYHYVVVDNATAQAGNISQIPLGTLARYSETNYLTDSANPNAATYLNLNILGLATRSIIKDSAGTILSQSEMVYDESYFSPAVGRALPTSSKVWDSTKGAVTSSSAFLTTHAKFDAYGNRTEATDAKGYTTVTDYDATYHAYPVHVTTPIPDMNGGANGSNAAFESSATFDPTTGLPLTATDANGQQTQMSYIDPVTQLPDKLLRLRKTTAPNGQQTTIEYGLGTSVSTRFVKTRTQIDAANWSEAIGWYDGVGRTYKTEKVDSQGNVFVDTEYDNMGRVKRSSNPHRAGETAVHTTPTYDDLGRTTVVTSPDGSTVHFDFGLSTTGVVGTTKTITDQAGKKRSGIVDALGRMTRVIEDPAGQNLATDYTFDLLGNLRKTVQGEQNRYFMYDSLGRLLRAKQVEQGANAAISGSNYTDPITNNNQWSVAYSYDDNGNILTTTDARNNTITGTYDRFNRLILRDYSDPSTPDVNFYYDGTGLGLPNNQLAYSKGKTTKITSSVSETRNTSFDPMGRLLVSQQLTSGQTFNFGYGYNLSGALVSETYPSGRVVTNTLNADGELETVASQRSGSNTAKVYANEIKYNSIGAVEQMRLGNGRFETAQYDPNRMQVKQIALGNSTTDKSLLKIDYAYGTAQENNGGLREQKISYAGLAQPIVQSYTYDSLNRVHSAEETFGANSQQSWKQTFKYDRYGNRQFDTMNIGDTTTLDPQVGGNVKNPLINTSDNRLSDGQGYSYDTAGNVTQDAKGQRFGYDAENRQTQFFNSSNNTQTPDATYYYDGEGKRVRKISGQTETIFVYDGSGQLAAEYSNQTPTTTPQVSYLTADHLGSPRIVTDAGGAVISRHDYMAFGDEVSSAAANRSTTTTGYNTVDNIRQQYTGYQKDEESGLDYAQARFYNRAHGRFTSVDPLPASATIKNPQTFNRYSYVTNSPYKFTDPLGLFGISPGGGHCGGQCSVMPLRSFSSAHVTVSYDGRQSQVVGQPQESPASVPETPPVPETSAQEGNGYVKVNGEWYVYDNDNPDKKEKVSEEVKAKLDIAASKMATNVFRAMEAVNALEEHPKVSTKVSFELSVSAEEKAKKLAPSGVEGKVTGETEYASSDSILSDLQLANDRIRDDLVQSLKGDLIAVPPAQGGVAELTKAGETPAVNAPNIASSFGLTVRKVANDAARARYNESFPERNGPSYKFIKQF